MPFSSRIITPTCLTHELPDDTEPESVHLELENIATLNLMRQLSSLIQHADDIFCDLTDECHRICVRTEKIQERITSIKHAITKLDYTTVTIPVGDLNKFSASEQRHDEFIAHHGYSSHLFTRDERPQCVKDQYEQAVLNPVKVISNCDSIRKDGYRGSMLFKIWPVSLKDPPVSPAIERKNFPLINYDKDYKVLKIKSKDPSNEENVKNAQKITEPDSNDATELCDSGVVAIDTTGVGFQRMCSFRQSLRKYEYEPMSKQDKKKLRRKTVSGVPEDIWKEISSFEPSQSNQSPCSITDKVKSYSFDDLDSPPMEMDATEMMDYLNQVEERIEQRELQEQAMKESKILRLIPCRRSRSSVRSSKIKAAERSKSEPRSPYKIHTKQDTCAMDLGSQSSVSVNSVASSVRPSRPMRRNLGAKLRSALSMSLNRLNVRERPKSLDLDRIVADVHAIPQQVSSTPEISSQSHDHFKESNTVDSMLDSIENKPVGNGSFYHFDSNTLPKMQAKKYNFPWDTLPKDWTTSVRLREISKRKLIAERQSSSGNWSAESSQRQSMDSAHGQTITMRLNPEATDSGRDSPSVIFECLTSDTAAGDDCSTITETKSENESIYDLKSEFSKLDTELWLRKLAIRAAIDDELSSSSSETLSSFSKMTKHNILSLEATMSGRSHKRRILDDQMSLYSQDNDGFYTSFHNDSGLRRSKDYLIDEDDVPTPTNDINVTSCLANGRAAIDGAVPNAFSTKRTPPPPPSRTSSRIDRSISINSFGSENSASFSLPEPSVSNLVPPESLNLSFSEVEQDFIYNRLKQKISVGAAQLYPSLCQVSPSETDEESIRDFKYTADHGFLDIDDEFSLDLEKNLTDVSSVKKHGFESAIPAHCNTIPRKNTSANSDRRSWPHSSNQTTSRSQPAQSQDSRLSQSSKSSNFTPVVNMYDPGTPPMLKPALRDENAPDIDNETRTQLPIENTFNDEKFMPRYKVSMEISDSEDDFSSVTQDKRVNLPEKYLPSLTVRPGIRPNSSEMSDREISTTGSSQIFENKDIDYPTSYRPLFDPSAILKQKNCDRLHESLNQSNCEPVLWRGMVPSSTVDSGIECFSELGSPSLNLTPERVVSTSSTGADSIMVSSQELTSGNISPSRTPTNSPSSSPITVGGAKAALSSFSSLNSGSNQPCLSNNISNQVTPASNQSGDLSQNASQASISTIVPIKTNASTKSLKKVSSDVKQTYTSDQIMRPSYTMMSHVLANSTNNMENSYRTTSYRNAVSLLPNTDKIPDGKVPTNSSINGKIPSDPLVNAKMPQKLKNIRPSFLPNKLNLSKTLQQAATCRSGSYRIACKEMKNTEPSNKQTKQSHSLLHQCFQKSSPQDVSPRTDSYRTAVFSNKTGNCEYLDTLQERNKSNRVALHENAMLRVNNKPPGVVYRGVSSVSLPAHRDSHEDKSKFKSTKSQSNIKTDDKTKSKLSRSKLSDSSVGNDDIDHVTDRTSQIGRSDKTSSTYICFDPIDELVDDDGDVLRSGSLTSLMTSTDASRKHQSRRKDRCKDHSKDRCKDHSKDRCKDHSKDRCKDQSKDRCRDRDSTVTDRSFHIIQPTKRTITQPATTRLYNAHAVHTEIETGV